MAEFASDEDIQNLAKILEQHTRLLEKQIELLKAILENLRSAN
jgi:hypothetical protein